MNARYVVVDGSNIPTEGRSIPSLAQLEAAVAELRHERPDAEVTVVVDATFAHRIDHKEAKAFEEAALRGEYVYPPAGAIGRGDAFLLRIAEKVGATVLSNDSFQEFHGEHAWLFEPDRLLGGTPVPGVGWIFTPRTPVRGPKSRVAVREADRARAKVTKAIALATKEAVAPRATSVRATARPSPEAGAVAPGDGRARPPRRASGSTGPAQAVNDPVTFISFVAEHPLGDAIEAEVEGFTSHGAIVTIGEMRCYVPLAGLGDPAPRSARTVLHKGEVRAFTLTALDPQRRGVELALPEVAVVSGRPSEETVAAEVAMSKREPTLAPRRRRASKPAPTELDDEAAPPAPPPPAPDDLAPTAEPQRAPRRRRASTKTATGAATEPPAPTPSGATGTGETVPLAEPLATPEPEAVAEPAPTKRRRVSRSRSAEPPLPSAP
jgi:hypothetical protein